MDEKIIDRALNGEINAYEKIVFEYERKVYNIAFRMFKNKTDAEDMAQEVFIKIYQKLNLFNFKSSFSTWIYRITVNTCLDEIRKRKREKNISLESDYQKEIESNYKEPERTLDSNEKLKKVEKVLYDLNEKHRVVIVLRDINGFSYDEIAKILDIKKGTVKSRISRARSKLIEKMELFDENERLNNREGGVK